jgi:hypothetical protein
MKCWKNSRRIGGHRPDFGATNINSTSTRIPSFDNGVTDRSFMEAPSGRNPAVPDTNGWRYEIIF